MSQVKCALAKHLLIPLHETTLLRAANYDQFP